MNAKQAMRVCEIAVKDFDVRITEVLDSSYEKMFMHKFVKDGYIVVFDIQLNGKARSAHFRDFGKAINFFNKMDEASLAEGNFREPDGAGCVVQGRVYYELERNGTEYKAPDFV